MDKEIFRKSLRKGLRESAWNQIDQLLECLPISEGNNNLLIPITRTLLSTHDIHDVPVFCSLLKEFSLSFVLEENRRYELLSKPDPQAELMLLMLKEFVMTYPELVHHLI